MNCNYCKKPLRSIKDANIYDANSNTYFKVKDWENRQFHKKCYKEKERMNELYIRFGMFNKLY